MKKKLIGTSISAFGLGVTVSAIVYPLGFMNSQSVFYIMLIIGAAMLFVGKLIGYTRVKE